MTVYGWDASHHDWPRGPMDIAAAVHDGITFATHKTSEGRSFVDNRFDDFYRRARTASVPLIGGYHVLHPGDAYAQADRFLALLDAKAPGWGEGPFILQVDAEKFAYMDRAPNLAEIRAFCDRLASRAGGRHRPVVYAPRWLYGDTLTGLDYPLWASAYGSNPAIGYRAAYPGDGSSRWAAYSGQRPSILQYGSRTVIGSQSTCDANAFRGTLTQLRALVHPSSEENDMNDEQDRMLRALYDERRIAPWQYRNADAAAAAAARGESYPDMHKVVWDTSHQVATVRDEIAALRGALVELAGMDWTDEEAIVTGVLEGLAARPAEEAAAVLLAVLTPSQVAALVAALTAGGSGA